MGHDVGADCHCVVTHVPQPEELHRHHIWPLADGGPDEEWNWVWLCPTSHVNVHELLREYRRNAGCPPWVTRRRFGPYIRALADKGWRWMVEGYQQEMPTEEVPQ